MLRSAAGGVGDKLCLRGQIIDYWVIDELDKQRVKERGADRQRETGPVIKKNKKTGGTLYGGMKNKQDARKQTVKK